MLSRKEYKKIKSDFLSPDMCNINEIWHKRIVSLFDTIEAQQQEIEHLKALSIELVEHTRKPDVPVLEWPLKIKYMGKIPPPVDKAIISSDYQKYLKGIEDLRD